MMNRLRTNGIAVLVAVGLSSPLMASAASPDTIEIAGVRVSFADLNIHDEAGAQVLYSRLKHASAKACDVQSLVEAGSLKRVVNSKSCYSSKLARSVAKVGSEALTRIHTG